VDVHHVRYFLAVVDRESVNAAASALGVAKPTISQAIRSLERDLGTPLFHRIGRGMVPTSAGYALVGSARRILRGIAAAEGAVRDREGQLRGRLDIYAIPAVSIGRLPRLISEYHRRHPKVPISIGKPADEAAVAPLLRNGQCEIVVTHLPIHDTRDRHQGDQPLDIIELGSQEYWIAYPPDSEIPDHNPLGWDELPDIPLVIVPPGTAHAGEIGEMMAAAGRLKPPAAVLWNRESRLAFALAGVGATFIERSFAGAASALGAQVRACTPPLSRPYGLVFDSDGLSPAAAAFVELARAQAEASGWASESARSTNARAAGES
jgi:DNA-binding transcriptional LysR family regulator